MKKQPIETIQTTEGKMEKSTKLEGEGGKEGEDLKKIIELVGSLPKEHGPLADFIETMKEMGTYDGKKRIEQLNWYKDFLMLMIQKFENAENLNEEERQQFVSTIKECREYCYRQHKRILGITVKDN